MGRYDFQSPGAAAGRAIQALLVQRAMEDRQAMLDAQAEEDRKEDREYRKQQLERQARLDELSLTDRQRQIDEHEEARRERKNKQGVQSMIYDAIGMEPTLSPERARTIGIMAGREGLQRPQEVTDVLDPDYVNATVAGPDGQPLLKRFNPAVLDTGISPYVPPKPRTVVQTTGPGGRPVRRAVTEDELIAGVPEYVAPREGPAEARDNPTLPRGVQDYLASMKGRGYSREQAAQEVFRKAGVWEQLRAAHPGLSAVTIQQAINTIFPDDDGVFAGTGGGAPAGGAAITQTPQSRGGSAYDRYMQRQGQD